MKRVLSVIADVVESIDVAIIHIIERIARKLKCDMWSGMPFFYCSIKLYDVLDKVDY
jgi:hypothetical protein